MEYWNNGKPHPPGNVIGSSRLKEISLTGITGNTEQESGVLEYPPPSKLRRASWSIGVLVKIVIRFRPLTSDL